MWGQVRVGVATAAKLPVYVHPGQGSVGTSWQGNGVGGARRVNVGVGGEMGGSLLGMQQTQWGACAAYAGVVQVATGNP